MALLNGRQWYQLYTIDWCKERGYDWLEFKREVLDPDYNGECYASFREFLDWEYEDKEYMQYLYDHKDELLRYADWELVESRKSNRMARKLKESKFIRFNTSLFDKMYDEWWYTIEGAGGSLDDWTNGYQEMFDEQGIGTIREFVTFSGKDMNDYYGLTGSNAYPNDFTFLAFPIDNLNSGKLAMFKLRMGDRWFTDIVDNNAYREEKF